MKTTDNSRVRSLILATGLTIGLCFVSPVSADSYILDINSRTLTALGTLRQDSIIPQDINDAGQVAGFFYSGGYPRAFITGPNGVGMTDLGTLGGVSSSAYGINDSGQAAGRFGTTSGQSHTFITGPNGIGITDLGTLNGVRYSSAAGINDAGRVVGAGSFIAGLNQHAFITGLNGVGMTDLGTLGGDNSYANGINNAGQVVGGPRRPQVDSMLLSPVPMA